MKRNSSMDEPLLVNTQTAAKMLAISPRLLWTLTNRGDIPCVRLGGAVRYDSDDLVAAIKKLKANGRRRTT